jgi:hypothetical protein
MRFPETHMGLSETHMGLSETHMEVDQQSDNTFSVENDNAFPLGTTTRRCARWRTWAHLSNPALRPHGAAGSCRGGGGGAHAPAWRCAQDGALGGAPRAPGTTTRRCARWRTWAHRMGWATLGAWRAARWWPKAESVSGGHLRGRCPRALRAPRQSRLKADGSGPLPALGHDNASCHRFGRGVSLARPKSPHQSPDRSTHLGDLGTRWVAPGSSWGAMGREGCPGPTTP